MNTLSPPIRSKLIPDQLFGMLIFVFTEVMFFTALVSAFVVIKGSRANWEIPAGVTLPVILTAYNTGVLLLSGIMLWLVGRAIRAGKSLGEIRSFLSYGIMFGTFFVAVQGYEWTQLLGYGLTMGSSIFGACFFLLIGSHALHALAGIGLMLYLYVRLGRTLALGDCQAVQVFWFFVVGVWPFLYALLYFP